MVPAGTGLVAAPPVRPVHGVARRVVGGRLAEQAGGLGDGQRGHSKVSGRRLIRAAPAAALGYQCGGAAGRR